MKLVFCLLVLVPLVLSASLNEEEKRFIGHAVEEATAKAVQYVVSTLGSDFTESACETTACPAALALIPGGSLLGFGCHTICVKAQAEINKLG